MNPADQRFEGRIWKTIEKMRQDLIDIKTAQPIGTDSLSVLSSNLSNVNFTLNPGQAANLLSTWNPANQRMQLIDFATSVFIDHDNDNDYGWRHGALLDSEQRKTTKTTDLVWGLSNDATGTRVYQTVIINNGTSPHDYFYYSRMYYLKGGAQ